MDTNSSVTVNAKVTLTWVADPADDPPPPTVWVVENASATAFAAGLGATATADDGLPKDPYINTPTDPDQDSAIMSTPSGILTSPPGRGRLQKLTVAGGTASFVHSMSASGTSTYSYTDPFPGIQDVAVSDTVTIHAQPYAWYSVGWYDTNGTHHDGPNISGGVMPYEWGWKSTSGSLNDFQGITIYEFLDYSGSPGTISADKKTYTPPSPPIISDYNQPNGIAGTPFDGRTLYARDVHSPFPVISDAAITITLSQKYEFDDPATNDTGTVLYDCGNIVEGNFLNPHRWDITELGSTAHTYYN